MRRPPPHRSRPAVAAGLLLTGVLGAAGCGADGRRTALAVQEARWTATGEVVVTFECSEALEVAVEPGRGTEGVPLVTAWGEPQVGRCARQAVLAVPPGTTRLDDAATGMVVDLPAPPAPARR
ncbi:MAG TPA: hypothetical protein VHK88_19575 [Aquihabitans sp.]|nr:hypothetical protein [Aquihabitans sp.]